MKICSKPPFLSYQPLPFPGVEVFERVFFSGWTSSPKVTFSGILFQSEMFNFLALVMLNFFLGLDVYIVYVCKVFPYIYVYIYYIYIHTERTYLNVYLKRNIFDVRI